MNRRNLLIGIGILIVIFVWMNSTKPKKVEAVKKPVSNSAKAAKQLYAQAKQLQNKKELVEARQTYQKILMDHSNNIDNIEDIQEELEELNLKLIFSNLKTPETINHEVKSGDTLGKLAKKYGTTVDLIKQRNNLKSDIIRLGQNLSVWTGKFNIFVDKSQNILILKNGENVVKVYRVSTGENNSTPIGTFKITSRLVDPVWFNRGVVVPPESPENVLGSRWLGFDIPGYGIHGTIEPETIGQQITAGCVRMRNPEVEELYSIIPTGTQVVVVD